MRLGVVNLVALTALALAGPLDAEEPKPALGVKVSSGFYTGNDYRELSPDHQLAYVAGVLDGYLASGLLDAHEPLVKALGECTSGWTNKQLKAVVDKYIAQNPEEWNMGMNLTVLNALRGACPGFVKAVKAHWKAVP